jgi:maltose-binding protein MalE
MTDKKLSRRDFLRVSALAAGGIALASCAPAAATTANATEAPAADAGPTATAALTVDSSVVTWWYAWGNLDPAIDQLVKTDEFKAAIGDNKFAYKGSVATEACLTAIAAGTPPDGGSNFDYPNFWSRGAVLEVTDMVNSSKTIQKDDMLAGLWEGSFYGGKMIGVPGIEGFNWWGLNYNSDAVTKAGLDPNKPPVTWDETLVWHKALTKFDDAGNLKQFGLDPYDAMAGEQDFAATSFGFKWWDESTNTFDLKNPLMAEALDKCGEFIRIVGPDKFQGMRQTDGMGGWGASYNAGVQTMIIEGYWHPGETQIQKPEIAKFNMSTWAPVSEAQKGHMIMATGPHFVQIFKDAKHHDPMFKVAELLITDKAQDLLFKEVGWIFGRKSWLAKLDKNTYPGLAFYVDASDKVTDWLIGRRCPIHWAVQKEYQDLREKVFRNTMKPQEAADELQKRAEAEWQAQGLG